jgi:hypothetical protein
MDRAYFVTNLGNNFPEAYFFHMKNSAQKNQSGEKKNTNRAKKKRNTFCSKNLAIVLVLADW